MGLSDRIYYDYKTSVSLASTGDVATFPVPEKMIIEEVGIEENDASVSGNAVVAFDRRITAGSDTGRVAAAAGTITMATTAQGKRLVNDANLTVVRGDQIVAEVTTADASNSDVTIFIRGEIQPDSIDNNTDVTMVSS